MPTHDSNEVKKMSPQNMRLKSELEKIHEELKSTNERLHVLESTLLVKSERERIKEEIQKLQAENNPLRYTNAELSKNIALQHEYYASYHCSSDLNKKEIVQSCELASVENELDFIDANDDLKPRGLIEEESRPKKPLLSKSRSADKVSATNVSTCGSSAASKLDIHNSLKHHENYASSGIKVATPNVPSQVSQVSFSE